MPDAAPPVLEVDGLEVRYGRVPAVRGPLVRRCGRASASASSARTAPGSRRRCTRSWASFRLAAGDIRLPTAARSSAGRPSAIARAGVALVPEGRHIFAGFTVEENLRLGLTARRSARGLAEDVERVYALFPVVARVPRAARRASSRAASSSSSRSPGRSSPRPTSCSSTSRRSASPRPSSTRSSTRWPRSAERGVTILLVEQRAQLAVAFADRTYVLANGELRLTLTPADAGNTELMTSRLLQRMNALQTIIDAVALGSIYALVAMGIGLIFGVMRLVNFAHGELLTAGAYSLVVTIDLPVAVADRRAAS